MVTILPKVKSFGEAIGANAGQGLGQGISEGIDLARENAAIKKNFGVDLSGVTNPQSRQQILAQELQYGRQRRQAEASGKVDYAPGGKEQGRSTIEEMRNYADEIRGQSGQKRQQLPEFLGGKSRNEEEGIPAFSHAPQQETGGKKERILQPNELIQEGKRIAKEQTDSGLPTSFAEGYETAKQINNDRKTYNSEVESDINQQVNSEAIYGEKGQQQLQKVMENPTPEQVALFQRKGEEISRERDPKTGRALTEAQINKRLAEEARRYKNQLANIKSSLPAPRIGQKIKEKFLGADTSWEQRKKDLQVKLKPLLETAQFETARDLLSELGYHPEERESVVTDLGENAKKGIANFPKIEKRVVGGKREHYDIPTIPGIGPDDYAPEQMESIKTGLQDILNSDPSTNLILLRKALNDKGVDWRGFKDALDDLILEGSIELNNDQFDHIDLLDYPSLDNLDKILYKV